MSWDLNAAVGLLDNGGFCPNHVVDQQIVADQLARIPMICGGLDGGDGPIVAMPGFVEQYIAPELLGAIQTFQFVQGAALNQDSRVEPNGPTYALLVTLANTPQLATPLGAMVTLDPYTPRLVETGPALVSGLPAIAYVLPPNDWQLLFDNGQLRVEIAVRGVLTASWGESFGQACVVNQPLKTLGDAMKSGSARTMGVGLLEAACGELRAQTRVAVHNLFSAVQVSLSAPGIIKLSGSIGDGWNQVSIGFEMPSSVTATGSITFNRRPVPLENLRGSVKMSGTLQCAVKITVNQPDSLDQASILAPLAVAGIVAVPVAVWLAESATVAGAAAGLGRAVGIVAERVMLGLSPGFAF